MMCCVPRTTFNLGYCSTPLKFVTYVDLVLCDENKSVLSNSRFLLTDCHVNVLMSEPSVKYIRFTRSGDTVC